MERASSAHRCNTLPSACGQGGGDEQLCLQTGCCGLLYTVYIPTEANEPQRGAGEGSFSPGKAYYFVVGMSAHS